MSELKALVDSYQEKVVQYRRNIHRHPELGDHEEKTSAYVESILTGIGIEVKKGYGGYGLVGIIHGGRGGGKCIGIRADMDALPIKEDTGLPFASETPGVMHACGHDMHTAILLGCAHVLYDIRDQFAGTVKLIFQPAEEIPQRGAIPCIEDGILQDPAVDAAIALHVSVLQTGKMRTKPGPATAASARFTITVKGRSGHAAMPNNAIDPIAMSAEVVSALQQIVSRKIPANDPCVVSIGTIHGGTVYNQLPDHVVLEGTCRCFRNEIMLKVQEEMNRICAGVTSAFGGSYELDFKYNSHPVINDDHMYEIVHQAMVEALGEENALLMREPGMASEDFGSFTEHIPCCYMELGAIADWQEPYPPHNAKATFDEDAIPNGMEVMVRSALIWLAENNGGRE